MEQFVFGMLVVTAVVIIATGAVSIVMMYRSNRTLKQSVQNLQENLIETQRNLDDRVRELFEAIDKCYSYVDSRLDKAIDSLKKKKK